MKLLFLEILFIFLVLGYLNKNKIFSKHQKQKDIMSLFMELERLGYYKYVNKDLFEARKEEVIRSQYVYGWEETLRDYHVDAENLAEGGVGEFFRIIEPFLTKQSVRIVDISEDFNDTGYQVSVNNTTYCIYDEQNLNHDNIWLLSTERAFAIVNLLLRNANSEERIYRLYGGNEMRSIFLTPLMFQAIMKSDLLDEEEKPVVINSFPA